MSQQGIYRGYSSFEFQATKSYKLNDLDLVKMDLLNHIFTKRGERVMMPTFGTRIPEMAFEPLDDETLEIIEDELRTVFEFDPRVTIISLAVIPSYDNNRIDATARLFYIELNMTDDFELNIQFEE